MGVPVNNTMIIQNGDVVELTPDSLGKGDPVKAGIELLDQSRNGIVDARVLKERQQLAVDGVVTILSAISTDGAMVAPPRVNLRGVVTTADARKMSLWTEREITWVLENRWKQLSRNTGDKAPEVDWMGVQREVEVGLSRRMRQRHCLPIRPLRSRWRSMEGWVGAGPWPRVVAATEAATVLEALSHPNSAPTPTPSPP